MTDATLQGGYRFAGHRVDVVTRELLDDAGRTIPLSGKAFDVLCHLIEHRDRIVGKDELLSQVWPGRVVEENNLSQAIAALRHALGGGRRHIITVKGRGYRFVAAIEIVAPDAPASSTAPPIAAGRVTWLRRHRRLVAALAGLSVLLLAVMAWQFGRRNPPPPTAGPASLAVLPFRQLSAGPPETILRLGMADTIVTRLSRSTSLVVRPLDASQRFEDDRRSPRDIARVLGVDYVIDGSTQRIGDQVRVNVRLLSVADGRVLWAQTFDMPSARLFGVQDRIADAVAHQLSVPLGLLPPGAHTPCEGGNTEAYRAYLSGRYLNNRPDSKRLNVAVRDFQRAIDLDPACARAYAGLAFAYRGEVMTGDRRPTELFPLAKAAVAQALTIDPTLPEAYATRGFIQFWYDWDWPAAERSLQKAIQLNPGLPEAHLGYAHLLTNLGRSEEAAREARLALQADPLSPLINTLAAGFLGDAGYRAEAKTQLDRALELDPDFWVALLSRGGGAMARGDLVHALSDLRRARALSHDASQAMVLLALAELRAGDRPAAERILTQLQARAADGYVPSTSLAAIELALGKREVAMDLLERAYDERDVRLSFLRIDHRFDALRSTPRFQALLRRMHLQDSHDIGSRKLQDSPGARF